MHPNDLKRLTQRGFPGMDGHHHLWYARIKQVHSGLGLHILPFLSGTCDLELLDDKLQSLDKELIVKDVSFARAARHIADPPMVDDIVLVAFPYWKANTAVVLAVLQHGQASKQEEGSLVLEADKELQLGSGEDNALLAQPILNALAILAECILLLGQAGNMGSPLPGYAQVKQILLQADASGSTAGALKFELEQAVSQIKLGLLTKATL